MLKIDPIQLYMQYLGVLQLLCNVSVHVPEEERECMEDALRDAAALIPALQWRRVLDRLDIEIVGNESAVSAGEN